MRIHLLSLFPRSFEGPLSESMLKRAQERGLLSIEQVDIRRFAEGPQRRVDDRPFGGGPGMVLMPGPVRKAIQSVKSDKSHTIYMSPRGRPLHAALARELARYPHLVILCGHYEGVDERALGEVDEWISIGDYVLTNGCLAASVLVDTVARYVPGVLGDERAADEDSFENHLLEGPAFTRPAVFLREEVPSVLQSGNHEEIARWRYRKALSVTREKRPDLEMRHLDALFGDDEGFGVLVEVSSLQSSCRFYKEVLGWKTTVKSRGVASVDTGGQRLMLVEVDKPARLRLRFAKVDASRLRRIAAKMRERGFKSSCFQSGQDREAIEFKDPNEHHFLFVGA